MVPLVGSRSGDTGSRTCQCRSCTAALFSALPWQLLACVRRSLVDSGTAWDGVVEDDGWSVLPYRDGAVEVVSVDLEEPGGCFDKGDRPYQPNYPMSI